MTKTKNTLLLVFFVLAAIVLSALIGELTSGVEYLKWLTWGKGWASTPSAWIWR